MPSLFDIGKSGLQAYRQSLAVTGQNIANVNTDGYKKRDASLAEVSGAGGGVTGGGVGAAGDHAVGSCSSPKYNEFFVIGNMIALCQGENETESRIHCVDLLSLIQGTEVE